MAKQNGKTWLLLRGLTREAEHWGSFIGHLKNAFPGSQFYTIDLPGSGEYFHQNSPYTISEMTDFVRKQALGKGCLNNKIYLLAFSLGGMTAWDWLQRFPVEIAGAVLINISMAGINPFYKRLHWRCYRQLLHIAFERDVFKREFRIVQLTSNDTANAQITAKAWAAIQNNHPVRAGNALRQLLAAARFRPKLTAPSQAVLLLNSLGDKLVSPRCSEAIGKRLSLPVATHPCAGHDICLDDPDWVICQMKGHFYNAI